MSKVFVSYAHSSEEHKKTVAALADTLRENGLTVLVDTDVKTPQGPPEGWPKWMKRQINDANWILIFFDETYRRRFDGEEEPDRGHGATWEGIVITHQLYRSSGHNDRFIPLLADGASKQFIPDELSGATFYRIPRQSTELATALFGTAGGTNEPNSGKPRSRYATLVAGEESRVEDESNLVPGTAFRTKRESRVLPWYQPTESIAPADWKSRWERLRSRFDRLIDDCQPLDCTLIQSRSPARRIGELFKLEDYPGLVQSGNGLERDPSWLKSPDGHELTGHFSVHSAAGDPICNTDGQPTAIRFGLSRYFIVYRNLLRYQDDARPVPNPQFAGLARDATALLYQLPAEKAVWLWRNWQSGFSRSRNSKEYLWLDALFELSWRSQPGSRLHTTRYARLGTVSIQLLGEGLFPRLPSYGNLANRDAIPNDGGHPAAWYCELSDVVRASVAAIDLILDASP